MELRRPLILDSTSGRVDQYSDADCLVGIIEQVGVSELINNERAFIVVGQPVYSNATGKVKKASASAVGTSHVLGLSADLAMPASTLRVVAGGEFEATADEWAQVIDIGGSLIATSVYYLSTTTGKITTTPPADNVVKIGTALTDLVLLVEIDKVTHPIEDVDHTSVTLTAGSGLSGGGDISASRTFNLDINELDAAAIAAGDFVPFWDITETATNKKITFANFEATLDHDSLTGFVASEHVDHSTVSILAGTGLTGGGTLESNRTLALSHLGIEALTDPGGDRIVFWDESENNTKWLSVDGTTIAITGATLSVVTGGVDHGGLAGLGDDDHAQYLLANGSRNLTGNLGVDPAITIDGRSLSTDGAKLDGIEAGADVTDAANVAAAGAAMAGGAFHDGFSDFVANEHIDHTSVTLTAGSGLSGGGDISASRTFDLDIAGLGAAGIAAADEIPFYDDTAGGNRKFTFADFEATLDHDSLAGFVADEHVDHTSVTLTAGSGLSGGGDISASRTFNLDINELDAAAIAAGDFVPFWDLTETATNKKITFADFEATLDHDSLTGYVAAEHLSLPNTIANVLSDHDLAAHIALGSTEIATMTNSNAGKIQIGWPVYCDGAGTVDLAKADASATVEVIGLVQSTDGILSAASGYIITGGILTATTGQWDTATGGSGGLSAGSIYYLDPSTAGRLTATAPTTAGQFVVRVGKALSATQLQIEIARPILL